MQVILDILVVYSPEYDHITLLMRSRREPTAGCGRDASLSNLGPRVSSDIVAPHVCVDNSFALISPAPSHLCEAPVQEDLVLILAQAHLGFAVCDSGGRRGVGVEGLGTGRAWEYLVPVRAE